MPLPMASAKETEKLTFLNIIIILLSIYVLIALMIDTFLKLPTEVSRILNITDNIICVVFLVDFSNRLYKAENKLHFMK